MRTISGYALLFSLIVSCDQTASAMPGEARANEPPTGIMLAQAAPTNRPAAVERAVTVVIRGTVQSVGYRDWTIAKARSLRVRGWVENAPDGTVHALFGGSSAAVEAMLAACRRGPPRARVTAVEDLPADPTDVPMGFRRRN